MGKPIVDVDIKGGALNTFGFIAPFTENSLNMLAVSGIALHTFGFIVPVSDIWAPMDDPITTVWLPTD